MTIILFTFQGTTEVDIVDEGKSYFNRRKGNTLDRSFRQLPRHLERGKNLSKRFRKSCRNWAAAKGLIPTKVNDEANKDTDLPELPATAAPDAVYRVHSNTDSPRVGFRTLIPAMFTTCGSKLAMVVTCVSH